MTRRGLLGAVGATMAATAGCLGRASASVPAASDWPQRGYDGGATYHTAGGSPPVEDADVIWSRTVNNRLFATLDSRWRGSMERGPLLDLTAHLDSYGWSHSDYVRTPIVVIGDRVYLAGEPQMPIDVSDGTVPERGDWDGQLLIGVAETETYRDGMIVGAGNALPPERRNRAFVVQGYRPPVDDSPWFQGTRRWTAGGPRDLERTAVAGRIDDGTVVTAIPAEEPPYRIVAIDADDGRLEWEHTVPHGVYRLRVDDGVTFVFASGESDGTVTILDSSSVRHRIEVEPTDLLASVRDGVAYLRDRGADDSRVSITTIDAESGEKRPLVDRSTVSDRIAGVPSGIGDLVVGPDRLFAAVHTEDRHDPAVVALNRSDGGVDWVRQFPGSVRLTGTDDALYVAGPREPALYVYALRPRSGDRLWSVELPDRSDSDLGVFRPVVADSIVLVPVGDQLVALEEL